MINSRAKHIKGYKDWLWGWIPMGIAEILDGLVTLVTLGLLSTELAYKSSIILCRIRQKLPWNPKIPKIGE